MRLCVCIWMSGHIFKKNSQKRTEDFPPSCTVQWLEFLYTLWALCRAFFNKEWTWAWKAARTAGLQGPAWNTCPRRASSHPPLSLSQSLAAGPGVLQPRVLLGLPPSSEEKPVLDNRPATGEEHRMLSVSSYAGALERLRGWGGGGSQGEIGQEKMLSVFWVTLGGGGRGGDVETFILN